MKKIYKREFERNDKRHLILYGYKEHIETAFKEIDITPGPNPHMQPQQNQTYYITDIVYLY